ncbi:MAG: MarC family protein [Methanofollis sp.]|uniref:MarC family protein n=1 Tax=Methanofollis sp. TaxID=2052835 RepID=UPI00261A4C89|nr:MarC family protein [Methanofollis sp.]MDD4254350.1 MarC family protein [Methanofollis sp.]
MSGDMLSFVLLSVSSIFIVINPLAATLLYVSLTEGMEEVQKRSVARVACWYALAVLLLFAIAGGLILQLFGITLDAFRIAGGLLLFGIGMEMVHAKTSRTKISATEKYESQDADDVGVMPLAIPMIAGPGAITTAIVLTNEATSWNPVGIAVVIGAILLAVGTTYLMLANSERIMRHVGQREYRAVNRLMGMMLIAIAVQFVITGIKAAFPILTGAGL